MRYLFLLFLIAACQTSPRKNEASNIDALMKENDSLKSQLRKKEPAPAIIERDNKSQKKYCYVLISYLNHEMGSGLEGLKDVPYVTWSDIVEVADFTDDTKYRLMDEFEKKFLDHSPAYFKKITKRECFFFNSYVEASKHLASKKSL